MGKCSRVSDPARWLLLWTDSWFYSILLVVSSTNANSPKGQEVGPRSLLGED